jgi:phage shock protein A
MAVGEHGEEMPVFTRLGDILNADIDAAVDKADDPQKLVKVVAQEIEGTLVEIKASCAAAMAARKRAQRAMAQALSCAGDWEEKARLAVQKRRDQLAREALMEKRRHRDRAEALTKEVSQSDALVRHCQDDIGKLEEKLAAVREKQRVLLERVIRARRGEAGMPATRPDVGKASVGSDQAEALAEPVPAGAESVGPERKPPLEMEFERLASDEDIERELQALKDATVRRSGEDSSATQIPEDAE